MRVVTAFNRQEPNLGIFNSLQADNTSNNVQISRVNGIYQPSSLIVKFIGMVHHPHLRRLPDRQRADRRRRRRGGGGLPVLGLGS